MTQTFKEHLYLFFILILIALEAIFFSAGNNKINIAFLNNEDKITKIQNVLADAPIQAKAVSVYDETLNRKIYGKNDEVSLPIASLTKIMTIVIALNNHSMDDVVSISPEAIKQETDYGFFINEKFNIKDLAQFTLIGSANDGAFALTENIDNFLGKMNDKAKKIGMENASFSNPTGLDIDAKTAGAFASAQDMNILAIYALEDYPEVFSASVLPEINIKSQSGLTHNIKNTNTILDKIPNILLSKTGFTPLAGGNLTIIYENKYGNIIAITVLGSTIDGRFSDMEKIVDTLYNLDYGSGN
jgi:D-alanyl-D-alanine carboxypeptidase